MCHMYKSLAIMFNIFYFVNSLKFVETEFQKPYLQVQTKNGIVQGTRLESKVNRNGFYYAYMGIPYAKPPLGPLRFRPPRWAENWPGVLDGSRESPACVETFLIPGIPFDITGSEDCLYLNIYTRNNPKKTKRLYPVMVFIFGGSFIKGNTDVTHYGPDLLVSKDVVVVIMNYRLGLFGFMNTEDLASPGNYGLKDQNLALQWVQKNIDMFGGDPNAVTLFGHSAGAACVNFHLLSPKSKGLFHRTILQSGSALCHWGSQRRPRNLAYLTGLANGITNPKDSEELVEKLREIDLKDLKYPLLASTLVYTATLTLFGLPFAPSIEPQHEEAFMSEDFWYQMMKNGEFNQVPTMMGTTSEESLFFLAEMRLAKPLLVIYDLDPSFVTPPAMNISDHLVSSEVGRMIIDYYLGPQGSFADISYKTLIQFITHDYFTRPLRKAALLMSKYIPLYFYHFAYQGVLGQNGLPAGRNHPGYNGVAHGEELYYIFNKTFNESPSKSDYLTRERMVTLWTNFAKYGNPTPENDDLLDNVIWPTVTFAEEPRLAFLEINETLKIRHSFKDQAYLNWWDDIFQKYAQQPLRSY